MKYSIRGSLNTTDGTGIVNTINNYSLWRFVTGTNETFTFEAWVNSEIEKNALFASLKPYVDTLTGSIDWHECSHDETTQQPCVIAETYVRG